MYKNYNPCPLCGYEKTISASRYIQEFDVDQEPYASGEFIKHDPGYVNVEGVMVYILYCEKCDTVINSGTDE